MRRFYLLSVLAILLVPILSGISTRPVAASSPIQISPFHGNGDSPCGTFYGPASFLFPYNGGTVWLAKNSDSTGNIYTDDRIDIEVTRSDGSTFNFTHNYGNGSQIVATPPQNVTSWFKPGNNTVRVSMTDILSPVCNSSEYWLVETINGGGNPPQPRIEPRSVWHAPDNVQNDSNPGNKYHIVIHHTDSANSPLLSWIEEFFLAKDINRASNGQRIWPRDVLSQLGDGQYASIAGTWPGEIWLIWARHNYIDHYTDIGYHYLIDPNGTIYEGRKGGPEAEGESVFGANTDVIAIAILGRYGREQGIGHWVGSWADGGVAEPTEVCLASAKELVDWLIANRDIDRNGKYSVPNCILSGTACDVPNIAGHSDFNGMIIDPITHEVKTTVCPGENIYKHLPRFRDQSTLPAWPAPAPTPSPPSGLIIGAFSPIMTGVQDPTGRRLGVDPATGQYVNEITNGDFGYWGFTDESKSHDPPFLLYIPNPVDGVYRIDVVGTGDGAFTIGAEELQTFSAMLLEGTITNGQRDQFQVIYSTQSPGQFELWHDNTPPVTSATLTCSRDMQGVCRSEATIRLSATDVGSGVKRIECSFDNRATWTQCGDASGGQFVLRANGQTQFWYRSIDRVLNVEEAKFSNVIDIRRYVAIAGTLLSATSSTSIQTQGVAHSNGDVTLTNNTTVNIDTLNYRGQFTQSGNVSLTINQQAQVTGSVSLPNYPLSHYDERCTRLNGPLVIDETSPVYDNLCVHASGSITNRATSPSGSLTLISDDRIDDSSTNANLQSADRVNGVQFYALAGYVNHSTGATINGIILAPNAAIDGPFTNSTLRGGLFAGTVSLGSGTTLNAQQAPGFPTSTYTLPLQPMAVASPDPLPPLPSPPTSLFPTAGRTMSNGRFALSWNVGSGAIATHVQVATANTFDAASLKVDLYRLGNSHSVNLSPGNYFWRAASVNRAGEVWSGTATFTVQTPTPTPIPTPTSTPVPAINRLVNPGFELDSNNDGSPDSWSTNSHFTRSTTMIHSGSYAGKHFATDNSGYTISQAIAGLTAGTTYNFSGWVNIPPTSDAFMLRIEVQWQNSSNAVVGISSVKTYTTATSGWNQTTTTFVAPPTTTNAVVRMVVSSLNTTVYVDDFEFK